MSANDGRAHHPFFAEFINGRSDVPALRSTPRIPAGSDLVLRLAGDLRCRGIHRSAELMAQAIVIARGARSVHVIGGQRTLRTHLAMVLATALPDTQVTWAAPSNLTRSGHVGIAMPRTRTRGRA